MVWRFSTNSTTRTIKLPRNFTTGYSSKGYKNTNLKIYILVHPSVHYSIIFNSQYRKAINVSIDRSMDKEDFIYVTQWNITQSKFCHIRPHGWTSRVLCKVKYVKQRLTISGPSWTVRPGGGPVWGWDVRCGSQGKLTGFSGAWWFPSSCLYETIGTGRVWLVSRVNSEQLCGHQNIYSTKGQG